MFWLFDCCLFIYIFKAEEEMRQRVALIAKIRAIESVPVIRFKVRDTFNLCFFNLHFWTAMLLYFAQTLRVELL